MLVGAPLNEILPEYYAAKGRKARQMNPAKRRRIGHTCADGKLLGVQGLIQTALFQDGFKRYALQLLVLPLSRDRFSVGRLHTSRRLNHIMNTISESNGNVPIKMALTVGLREFACVRPGTSGPGSL